MGDELLHADEQTHGLDEANSLFSQFCEGALNLSCFVSFSEHLMDFRQHRRTPCVTKSDLYFKEKSCEVTTLMWLLIRPRVNSNCIKCSWKIIDKI